MSLRNPHSIVGESVLPFEGGLPPQSLDINWAGRITITSLLDTLSKTDESREATGSVTQSDLQLIDPLVIGNALLVGRQPENEVAGAYRGLVLPKAEYDLITARLDSPAERIKSRNQQIRQAYRDGSAVARTDSTPPVFHSLEDKMVAIDEQRKVVKADAKKVGRIQKEVVPALRDKAHYRADNLYDLVIDSKRIIGQMIEVAGVRMGWTEDRQAVAAQALYVKLLGLAGDSNQRLDNWSVYAAGASRYARNREVMLRTSITRADRRPKRVRDAAIA